MMWTHVTSAFLQVSWLEPKFSFPVTVSSASFSQLHAIPGTKKQNRGTIFKWCGVPISWAYLFSRTRVCLSSSKYISIANMADTASIEQYRQQFFQPTRCPQDISKPQFSSNPRRVWVATNFLSRGNTPLYYAAGEGHDSVVKRLLEAKAAVDLRSQRKGRGLGGGFFWGKPHETWDRCEEENEILLVQVLCDHDSCLHQTRPHSGPKVRCPNP